MSTPFKDAVRSVVDDMIRSGGSGTHVHFDDTVFDGLVPSFDDTVWLSLGREAAIEALESGTKVVVAVPIAETASRPASLSLVTTASGMALRRANDHGRHSRLDRGNAYR
jgi:hypothetical protein